MLSVLTLGFPNAECEVVALGFPNAECAHIRFS
jgi:hypothetical protein